MKDEETYELVLTKEDMIGCPSSLMDAAQAVAKERGKDENRYVITTSRSLVEPFLTYADRRDLRQTAFTAWTSRGEMDLVERNNLTIAQEMLKLRQRIARLHGYKNYAEYQCVDRMAKTPGNVIALLENVWQKAKVSADIERQLMEDFVANSRGGDALDGGIQPWDWRYYAEKVRQMKYDFDESLLKPYLSLEQVTRAVFAVSHRLFGLRYTERPDLPTYDDAVRVYEVRNANDRLQAIFVHDNYARPYKSGGAWMSEYRTQTKNLPRFTTGDHDDHGAGEYDGVPIVSNNNNFARSANTLLSFDDATTLFHEMV
jgi:peptidyl-dipeptidase Dcp